MEKIKLDTIEFVNKGDTEFATKKKPLNADNLNKIQENVNNALSKIQDKMLFFATEEEWEE